MPSKRPRLADEGTVPGFMLRCGFGVQLFFLFGSGMLCFRVEGLELGDSGAGAGFRGLGSMV